MLANRVYTVASRISIRSVLISTSFFCLAMGWCGVLFGAADHVQSPFDSRSHQQIAQSSAHVVFKRSDTRPGLQDINIVVELASTQQEMSRGLMFREHLDENRGMLFLFDSEQPLGFWMKNTLIALDIIFIDEDFKIISAHKRVPPCRRDPCPVYGSGEPAKFVVEVNAGFVERYGISEGGRVEIKFDADGQSVH